jgi:hypothetical protein
MEIVIAIVLVVFVGIPLLRFVLSRMIFIVPLAVVGHVILVLVIWALSSIGECEGSSCNNNKTESLTPQKIESLTPQIYSGEPKPYTEEWYKAQKPRSQNKTPNQINKDWKREF